MLTFVYIIQNRNNMTTIELKTMKMELVQAIVDEINTEEMRDSLEETFKQYENNELIPHKQIKRL